MSVRIIKGNLVFEAPSPGQLKVLFPDIKFAYVGAKRYCALPHTLDVARVLNNIGYKAPSPIRTEYQWPTAGGRYKPRWYQNDTAEFLTLNMRAHCHNKQRCVDGSTEYLTPTGWKRIDSYVDGDVVAQWDPKTDRAEFVIPLEYIDTPCSEMIHIKSQTGLDQMLTAEHRVPYFVPWDKSKTLREAQAGEIYKKHMSSSFAGLFPVTFKAPARPGLPISEECLRIMVAVIADGYFPYAANTCVVRLKKERKKVRLEALLKAANIPYTVRSKDFPTAKGFSIYRFKAPRREKEFTTWWWDASEEQLEAVVDEVQHWDSSPRRSTAFAFSTYRVDSAEFIQYAAVATKRVASLNVQVRERRGNTEREYVVYVRGNGNPIGLRGSVENRRMNIVPSPDGRCYCFSVPSTYIIFRRNGCVFISGNTGKTLSALWAADYLRQQGEIQRTLIIAPLSTLWDVWEQILFETFPLRTFTVLHGSAQRRLDLLAEPKDFYIVNHHGVAIIESALAERPDINHIIYDEVAVVRNGGKRRKPDGPQGTLYEPAERVVNKQNIKRTIWGLTGTPTPNAPTDAYGQSKLITPWLVKGQSFTAFKQTTMMKIGDFKWVPLRSSAVTVARVLKPSIMFDRSVCTDMEPVHIYRRSEMSKEQEKAYKDLKVRSLAEIAGQNITAVNASALLQKIIQCMCGAVLDVDKNVAHLDTGPRLAVLKELIEENEEKVIVFAPFTATIDLVAKYLSKWWTVDIIDGRVSTGKRNQLFKDFRNTPNPHIFVCHPGTMSYGLDLTAASLEIWYAPYWKAGDYQQANARIDGSKQSAKIDIAHIYATPEEQGIYQVLQGKGRMQDVVLSMSNER